MVASSTLQKAIVHSSYQIQYGIIPQYNVTPLWLLLTVKLTAKLKQQLILNTCYFKTTGADCRHDIPEERLEVLEPLSIRDTKKMLTLVCKSIQSQSSYRNGRSLILITSCQKIQLDLHSSQTMNIIAVYVIIYIGMNMVP